MRPPHELQRLSRPLPPLREKSIIRTAPVFAVELEQCSQLSVESLAGAPCSTKGKGEAMVNDPFIAQLNPQILGSHFPLKTGIEAGHCLGIVVHMGAVHR